MAVSNTTAIGTTDYLTPDMTYDLDARNWANLGGMYGVQQQSRLTDAYKQWQTNQGQTNQLTQKAYDALSGGTGIGPSAPTYNQASQPAARQDLSGNIPFLGQFTGNYPTGLSTNYASQVKSPETNYGTHVNTSNLGTWNAGADSQYNVDAEVLKALNSGATPEDIRAQVERAYGTLGSMDLQNYGSSLGSDLESNLARRGITGSTGAINKQIGLSNWQQTQGARLGAEGTLAGISAEESARAARNSSLLSGEGLKQSAAASALGVGTTEEQVRAARAAEIMNALSTASGLQNQYTTGSNEATRLASDLSSNALNLERQGVLDVENIKQARAAQALEATQAQDAIQKGLYGESVDASQYNRQQELMDYANQLAQYWQTMGYYNDQQNELAGIWTGANGNGLSGTSSAMSGVEGSEAASSPWDMLSSVFGSYLGGK